MKVLACGGRDYNNVKHIFDVLDKLHEDRGITVLIHGECRGTDKIAGRWANYRGIQRVGIPANWEGDGDSAGPKRNQFMYDFSRPDLVIAFPGGPGTANMIRIARSGKTEVILSENILR